MNVWAPYHPVAYFLHTVLGTLGVVAGAITFSALKGSPRHVGAGRIFAGAATVAALSALVFSFTRFSPFAVASSLIVMGLLTSAILAVRPRTRLVAIGEAAAVILMLLAALGLLMMAALPLFAGAPITVWAWPLAYALFPLWFLANDARSLRLNTAARDTHKLTRHLSRMAFALAIGVHAPLVSFGDRLGIDPVVAFFGPFVLWPIIVMGTRKTESAMTAAAN